jgi:hypothetical protein
VLYSNRPCLHSNTVNGLKNGHFATWVPFIVEVIDIIPACGNMQMNRLNTPVPYNKTCSGTQCSR